MKFFYGNEWYYRLLRTIVQGVLGVVVANLDMIFGTAIVISPEMKPMVVALVMAVLSPIMAEIGGSTETKTNTDIEA